MLISGARRVRALAVGLAAGALLVGSVAPAAAGGPSRSGTLVPIGSDYQAPTLQLFAREAVRADRSGHVAIVVLPITYSDDAYTISDADRADNLELAGERTQSIEDACNAVKRPSQTCDAVTVPVLIRSDAYRASNVALFTPDVDGMYVLGGDQGVAMQVVAGTPVEAAMTAAFRRGAVLGGNSAGDAVQSRTMINGWADGFSFSTQMRQGAVDVWSGGGPGGLERGLAFGTGDIIMDQHVFEYGRMGRSMNVALQYRRPVLGMDAATGGVLKGETLLGDVTGFTGGYVIDPRTWGASATWAGPNATLSARRVALHVFAPGFGYDFRTMRPIVNRRQLRAPQRPEDDALTVSAPRGAAPLILSGGILDDPGGLVGQRFVALAGGPKARIVILAAGYADSTAAAAATAAIGGAMSGLTGAPVTAFVLDSSTPVAAAKAAIGLATGILVTAPDRSLVGPALAQQRGVMDTIRARWASGRAVLLADNAAAAALGPRYVADPVPDDVELAAQEDLLPGGVTFASGLGWFRGATVSPQLVPDQNWGQMLRLLADGRRLPAVGIDVGTSVEVSGGLAVVRGDSAAVVFDGSRAWFGRGTNGSLAALWVEASTYAAGQALGS